MKFKRNDKDYEDWKLPSKDEGSWMLCGFDSYYNKYKYRCTACRQISLDPGDKCPKCGATMKGIIELY